MTNIEDQVNAHAGALDGIVVAPRGGLGARSRGPRTETVASAIEGGWYLNLYPSDGECEKMRKWPHGVNISVKFAGGKPDVLRLRQAPVGPLGHTLRKKGKSSQREHIAVPTQAFGRINGSVKGRVVETWTEGDAFCVRISSFYSEEQAS